MFANLWLACLVLLYSQQVCGYRDVIRPRPTTKSTSTTQRPWTRQIYGTKVEIVTPTVVAGVTFSAKPKATPDPLEPWISLKKDGTPQTIHPEIKNGRTKNASPTYSTYFQTATIKQYSYDELKAHNMDPDEIFEEEIFIEEDKTYVSLNPIIRCTPDRYLMKGLSKDISSEPFCTPKENSELKVDQTYFVSWYTRFFENEDGEKEDEVRIHLSYVKESAYSKGTVKRSSSPTFFSSEWIKNLDGMYPLEVMEEWLQGEYSKKAVISIQPKSIPDEEFDLLENGVLVNIALGTKVFKKTREQLELEDEGLSNQAWYYVVLSMPTVVVISVVFMYFFLQLNSRYRDFSDIKRKALSQRHRVIGKFKDIKKYKNIKNHRYEELPLHKSSKQS